MLRRIIKREGRLERFRLQFIYECLVSFRALHKRKPQLASQMDLLQQISPNLQNAQSLYAPEIHLLRKILHESGTYLDHLLIVQTRIVYIVSPSRSLPDFVL